MPQLFSPGASSYARVALIVAPLAVAGIAALAYAHARSDSTWNVGAPAPQPIPFRHDLHAGALGIACAFCHGSATRSAHAGMPSAETCMTCHSQVWAGASVLQPLLTSLALDQPIRWTSVHRLPGYVRFDHAAHVSKGLACGTCHGDTAGMTKTVRAHTLSMGWCLDCHREPQRYVTPQQAAMITGLARRNRSPGAEGDQVEARQGLYAELRRHLTDCSTCHR